MSVIDRVGKHHWEIECSCNVRGPKCPLTAIDREVDGSWIGVSPGCHGVIELNDHLGVEKPVWGYKRLQGVPLHKSHRISKLEIVSKNRKVIIGLTVQFFGTTI